MDDDASGGKAGSLVQKVVLGGKGEAWVRPEGVIHVCWFPGVSIEEQDADAARRATEALGKGRRTLVLVDISGISGLNRAARAAFTRRSSARRIALLGTSPVDQIIANFFLTLNKPSCPTRYFTTLKEAKTWLHAHRIKPDTNTGLRPGGEPAVADRNSD